MLPQIFKPRGSFDLIRLGKDNDGGYLVERTSIQNAKSLISFGLSLDWSFEKSFVGRQSVPLDAYDHTITNKLLKKRVYRAFRNAVYRAQIKEYRKRLYLYRDYKTFFTGEHNHYEEMIGLRSLGATPLVKALSRQSKNMPVFLKIDIEGWEYRIIDELVKCSEVVCGLVIEFHDVDLHRERIGSFIRSFPLTLVHVHPNNYGGVDDNGDPLVLEMTFSGSPELITPAAQLPHRLDQPNSAKADELSLSFG